MKQFNLGEAEVLGTMTLDLKLFPVETTTLCFDKEEFMKVNLLCVLEWNSVGLDMYPRG